MEAFLAFLLMLSMIMAGIFTVETDNNDDDTPNSL